MKWIVIVCFVVVLSISNGFAQTQSKFKVRHSVVFTLKYPKGSAEEKQFFDAARKLSSIAGVHHFEVLSEVSSKNNYEYGLSMEFDSAEAYQDYQKDPAHNAFVQANWTKYVKDFMELDFEVN